MQNAGCKNRVIVFQKEKEPGCFFSFWITMILFLHPALCTPYFGQIFFQDHKMTHVFKTRIVGAVSKGQIISECLLMFLNFPKNQWKIWQISAPESKKWSNHKIMSPCSVFNTLNSPNNFIIIRKCLYFVDLTTF